MAHNSLEVLTYVHEAGINLEGVTLDNVYLSLKANCTLLITRLTECFLPSDH